MRALQYLKDRMETAAIYKKPIYIINRDIQALNQLIEFVNTNKDSELEDSLLLFYIMKYWRLQIKEEIASLTNENAIISIDDVYIILNKLVTEISSKEMIIDEIHCDLLSLQKRNRAKEIIHKDVVRKMLEDVLTIAKKTTPLNKLKYYKHDTAIITNSELNKH